MSVNVISIPENKIHLSFYRRNFSEYRWPNFETEPRSMIQVHREESGNELEQTRRQRLRHDLI